jgi:hypothetical protein
MVLMPVFLLSAFDYSQRYRLRSERISRRSSLRDPIETTAGLAFEYLVCGMIERLGQHRRWYENAPTPITARSIFICGLWVLGHNPILMHAQYPTAQCKQAVINAIPLICVTKFANFAKPPSLRS